MLYGKLIKPLLFSLPPEQAHHIVTATLSLLGKVPGGRWLLHKLYATEDPSLEREVFGIRFKNPVGMAAGFDRYGHIYRELSAMGFGFVEVGSITPKRQPGNPKPRIFRLDAARALLNRVGKEIVDNGKKVGGAVTSTATEMIRHELRGGNKKIAAGPATRRRPTTSNASATSTSTPTISRSTSPAIRGRRQHRTRRAKTSRRFWNRSSNSAAGRTSTAPSC